MRVFFYTCFAFFLFSCNSSSKKNPNQSMDDTARMNINSKKTTPAIGIQPVNISAAGIPASIEVKGKVREAWKWNDLMGENILITSYVSPYDDKNKNKYGEEGETAELHAYHYVKKDGDYVQVWTMNDAAKACPFDITCDFIPGSTTVTDLDKDGIAETKIQYAIACRSDVSPAMMKLILHESGTKYALQGNMWLPYSPDFIYTVTEENVNLASLPKLKNETDEMLRTFGRYENEKEFTTAPPGFLPYARNEWLKYVKEKMGE